MKKQFKIVSLIITLLIMAIFMIGYVLAAATEPTGPSTLTRNQDSKFSTNNWPGVNVSALAGNVTELNITSLTQTQTWQGYYGNVTGTIVLDDAENWTLYSWNLAEPQGEIYASNSSTVIWSKDDKKYSWSP